MAARRWRHLQLARPWLPLLVSCASGTCCSSVVLQDPEGSSGLSSPPSRPTCIHPLLQDPEGTLRGPLSTPGVEDPGGSGAFLLSLLQRPWFFDNQSTRTQSLIINMYGTVPTCFLIVLFSFWQIQAFTVLLVFFSCVTTTEYPFCFQVSYLFGPEERSALFIRKTWASVWIYVSGAVSRSQPSQWFSEVRNK